MSWIEKKKDKKTACESSKRDVYYLSRRSYADYQPP